MPLMRHPPTSASRAATAAPAENPAYGRVPSRNQLASGFAAGASAAAYDGVCPPHTRSASASPSAATSKRVPLVTNTGRGVHGAVADSAPAKRSNCAAPSPSSNTTHATDG